MSLGSLTAEPESQGPTEANKPSTSSAFNLVQADEPGVSTFDDDDDDFEIHLDKIEPQAADDEVRISCFSQSLQSSKSMSKCHNGFRK